jgi:hypothetical protein
VTKVDGRFQELDFCLLVSFVNGKPLSGEFVIPGFVEMSVVKKPATEARSGIKSLHEGADGIRSQTSQQDGQGLPVESS